MFTAAASCADTIVWQGGTLVAGHDGGNFSGGLDLNGPLLKSAPAARFPAARWPGPLGVGTLTLSSRHVEDDGGGRTLATAVTIDGNVTLASAGSTGVSFAPLGLTRPMS